MSGRIDVHHHILPPEYLDAIGADRLAAQASSRRLPAWSVEDALERMDAAGVARAIVSISAPAVTPLAPDVAVATARRCNAAARRMADDHPGRFGSFATLPLPDVDAALAETAHALDALAADGLCLMTNYGGRYLGEAWLHPLYAELDRRRAVVFVHPTPAAQPVDVAGASPSLIEFPFETTRAIVSLLLSGVLNAFPGIEWIFAHAGGTLPYLAGRVDLLLRNNPALREAVGGDVLGTLRRPHHDLALSYDAMHLGALRALVGDDRILFGTDYPFGPADQMADAARSLDRLALEATVRTAIESENALRLLSHAPRTDDEGTRA